MKKLIVTLALFASLISAAFAENIFSHRFFEIKLDVPVNISNNLIAVADIFKEKVATKSLFLELGPLKTFPLCGR